jgi:hypothetical protein
LPTRASLTNTIQRKGIMFWKQKPRTVLSVVLSKTISEGVKAAAKAFVTATVGSAAIGEIAGAASKALVDALADRVSSVERKLDRLLRVDLISGVRHLRDGLHQVVASAPPQATDPILHSAHEALTRAWAVALDSREDSAFVRSLDAVSLAAHSSRRDLALVALSEVDNDLNVLRSRVELLRTSEQGLRERSEALDRFVKKDEWRDKPWGYQEQRLYARWVRDGLPARQAALHEAENRLKVIELFADVARRFASTTRP